MQELNADLLLGAPSDCESDENRNDDDGETTMTLGPQRHRETEKERG
jgi:hypothetical protein